MSPAGPRWLRALLAPIAVLLAFASAACTGALPDESPPSPQSPSSAILEVFDVGGPGWEMSETDDHLWVEVGSPVDGIVRVEKSSGEATPIVPDGSAVEAGAEGLWVSCCGRLAKIDPLSGAELLRVPRAGTLALGEGFAWLYGLDGTLVKVDTTTGELQQAAAIDPELCADPKDLLIDFGFAWLACSRGVVVRMDLAAGTSSVLPTAGGTHTFAATDEDVWVTNEQAGSVMRIDPDSAEVTEIPGVGTGVGITAGGGFVWASDADGIAKIDPETNKVIDHIDLGTDQFFELVWDDGVIWTATTTARVLKVDAR
ncbi:hypothetical protein NQ152_11325 [Microbacterium sp. zg.B48]|uniref:hypothetical protein n=1 Tax=Microbacterium sp. zg.B48 TaxID=2969408 RepID=UPI00214C13B2|nr:hypothetical protein [Microbacterium sp. zg.B48]MCR2764095.1 hypothetical protein [Microbacterium sp. zg.B48]